TVPAFEPISALPSRYLLLLNGQLSSFDWPGAQVAWAFSELTRSGPWVFALSAGLAGLFVAKAIAQRLGRVWAADGAALFLLSPMMLTLSFSSHAHLLSRGLLAIAIWAYLAANESKRWAWWVATGFAIGAAFFCRPMEIACLVLPLVMDVAVRA